MKASTPQTSCPSSSRRSARCDPINPATTVTRQRIVCSSLSQGGGKPHPFPTTKGCQGGGKPRPFPLSTYQGGGKPRTYPVRNSAFVRDCSCVSRRCR